MKKEDFISIGKITNFFGIKGEAKVGFDNENQIKNAKSVFILDDESCCELKIKSIRFHKNFAIIKFEGIDDINELLQYKGQRIFTPKKEALNKLEKDEFLIQDLIGCVVYNEQNEKIGEVVNISTNSSQDLLNIKNGFGKVDLVPFVNEFFPIVDIKNKKIIIKPIEGLLS
ncbi:MAG: 16S rRNA processing protein RimM [Candidatus Gastranaerophilales bacterium]|nr:16S rRNA processing protein RimM [Candidatus Gastranaerophilales bacterium]